MITATKQQLLTDLRDYFENLAYEIEFIKEIIEAMESRINFKENKE